MCETPGAALTQADCQWLGNRLERMYDARPKGALSPYRLATALVDSGEVEALQLEAFEAGVERWWELTGAEEEVDYEDLWAGLEAEGPADAA